jgi:hypothetical protein
MSPRGSDKASTLLAVMIQKLLTHKKIRALNSRKECHKKQDLTGGANIFGIKITPTLLAIVDGESHN